MTANKTNKPENYEKKKCIICRKIFMRVKDNKKGHRAKASDVRPKGCITCSKKCSQINYYKRERKI